MPDIIKSFLFTIGYMVSVFVAIWLIAFMLTVAFGKDKSYTVIDLGGKRQ